MEDIDYKHFTFELISAIKARVDFKEGDQVGLTREECSGMRLGYSYIME
ncbi:hypothetical protein [Flavobacterium suaedae]|nr:hypothetical protein [Flavobacterium suaedae]